MSIGLYVLFKITVFQNKKYASLEVFVQDLSGRPYLGYDLQIPTERVGTYDTQVV